MKINIEIECSPAEAREFSGLPDLQPMQQRVLADMEQHFREAAAKTSPEAVMQQWFSVWPEHVRQGWEKVLLKKP